MSFTLRFLRERKIPSTLINKIRRYLEYNFELKRAQKIEELEVFDIINDDLRGRITVHLNGKILKSVAVF
jgi:hypothetical protein